MKTSYLLVFLLGFGYLWPMGCGKKSTKAPRGKQESKQEVKEKKLTLFGPVIIVKDSKPSA